MRLSLVSLCLLSLVACGGDDDGGNPMLVDAGPGSGGEDAPPAANCAVATSYSPTFNAENSEALSNGSGAQQSFLGYGFLNADAAPDSLDVYLFPGYGTFSGGAVTTKTIPLTGMETDFADCGACVIVSADLADGGAGAPAQEYLVTGGTLELTSITGNLEFTLRNATFQRVTIDWENSVSTPANDGCATSITEAVFSAPLPTAAALTSSKGSPIRLRAQRVTKR